MPCKALFVSHGGGPLPLLNSPEHRSVIQTLRDSGENIDGAKGIILFTAHWETSVPHISGQEHPGIFYDYAFMKDELAPESFEFDFHPRGDPVLAREIADCLTKVKLKPIIDEERGCDHAVFVPMQLMRPDWDIPIVQMSVVSGTDEADTTRKNLALARAMQPLVDRGYTIVGSGSSSHDFKMIWAAVCAGESIKSDAWAFEEAMVHAASIRNVEDREQELMRWRDWPESYSAHLRGHVEHFMPFLIAAASVGDIAGERVGFCDLVGTPQSVFAW